MTKNVIREFTGHSADIDHVAEKNASYSVRVARNAKVRCLRDVHVTRGSVHDGTLVHGLAPAGTVFTAWGADSNAGFRGIEVLARYFDANGDVWMYQGTTGCLEVVR